MAFLFSLYSTNTKVLSHDTIQNLSNFRHFSPCSRGGSDFIPRLKPGNQFLFQSTLPRRERRIHVDADIAPTSFQSTLPHGERRRYKNGWISKNTISIHAPAWGATIPAGFPALIIRISIHAPAKGATNDKVTEGYYARISIHAPAKGATPWEPAQDGYRAISIHAPAKGATIEGRFINSNQLDFNPRSREGSDRPGKSEKRGLLYFNPRSREGSDTFPVPVLYRKQNFNPRSREGSDSLNCPPIPSSGISIHAPAKGATFLHLCLPANK